MKRGSRNQQLSVLQSKSKEASRILHDQYGSPRHGNKRNPIVELVFIILSIMTTHHSFNRVYKHLKKEIGAWENILVISHRKLKSIIKDGGLSDQKARHIKGIMRRI